MGAFTYPRSEPGSGGHQDLVEAVNVFVGTLLREVSGLPEQVLTYRPSEDAWSIKEHVGHLCDDAKHDYDRLYRMIKQEDPRLPAWDQDEAHRARDPQSKPIDELLSEFAAQRAETVEMLAGLVHWNWARTGRHEEWGRLSIRQLVDRKIAHQEEHLATVRALKEQAQAAA